MGKVLRAEEANVELGNTRQINAINVRGGRTGYHSKRLPREYYKMPISLTLHLPFCCFSLCSKV